MERTKRLQRFLEDASRKGTAEKLSRNAFFGQDLRD